MLHALLLAAAQAQDPQVAITPEGHVEVRMHVTASPESVKALLADVQGEFARLSPETLSVKVRSDGGCQIVTRSTKGLFRPFEFEARRCPTAEGFRETLFASEDFTAYQADWKVEATEGGSEVVYRVQTEVNVPVPSSVVRANLKVAAGNLVKALADRFRRARAR